MFFLKLIRLILSKFLSTIKIINEFKVLKKIIKMKVEGKKAVSNTTKYIIFLINLLSGAGCIILLRYQNK